MAYDKKITFDVLRQLAFGSIAATYNAIGTATTRPARSITFVNGTDEVLIFSTDGTNDFVAVPISSSVTINFTASRTNEEDAFFPVGTVFFVRHLTGAAPTEGLAGIVLAAGEND